MFLTPSNSLYLLHKKPWEVSDCLFDRNRPCGSRGYEAQEKKGAEQESPAVYPAGSAAAACTSSACRYPHLSSFTGTAQPPPPEAGGIRATTNSSQRSNPSRKPKTESSRKSSQHRDTGWLQKTQSTASAQHHRLYYLRNSPNGLRAPLI